MDGEWDMFKMIPSFMESGFAIYGTIPPFPSANLTLLRIQQ